MAFSFYWHDYETFGIHPQKDRPAQFAGVRTDENLNIIDDPMVVYCKVPLDYLPNPDSCVITGITPQLADEKGVCEAQFIRQILSQLAQANTCTVGYNNLRFDDEVTRNCLYRNFYDPYAREWQNGNSRWDLMDVFRAARALRPEGIAWPLDQDGNPTLKLDHLTIANGIAHESAHDALSDVYATIAIAKLLKQAQPKLYQFLFQNRGKNEAYQLLKLGEFAPIVHVSGKYPTIKNNLAIVLPICKHPSNTNGVIVYDLSEDPSDLISLSVEEIRLRIFTATKDLPENTQRIPLKTVHLNKCPVLAPLSVIRPIDAERLNIDKTLCEKHRQQLIAATGLAEKIAEVFNDNEHLQKITDPDLAIYSGGFFSNHDKQQMAKIHTSKPHQLSKLTVNFNDRRLDEMFFRYKARNYPNELKPEEMQQWREFCQNRLNQKEIAAVDFESYFSRLQTLREQQVDSHLINALFAYGEQRIGALHNADNYIS